MTADEFAQRCWARAQLWVAGQFGDPDDARSLHEAVDALQYYAMEDGLVARIGQDACQALMAAAFAAVRE